MTISVHNLYIFLLTFLEMSYESKCKTGNQYLFLSWSIFIFEPTIFLFFVFWHSGFHLQYLQVPLSKSSLPCHLKTGVRASIVLSKSHQFILSYSTFVMRLFHMFNVGDVAVGNLGFPFLLHTSISYFQVTAIYQISGNSCSHSHLCWDLLSCSV